MKDREKRSCERKKLKKFFLFDSFECKAAEDFLQEMAQKGWRLEKVNGAFFNFVPMEPQRLRYTVKVFDAASMYDLYPSEKSLTYIDYCESAGWHFVSSIGKIYFFYEKKQGAVDIDTDSKLELKAVVKSVLFRNIFMWIFFPLMLCLNLCNTHFIHMITSYFVIFTDLLMVTMCIGAGVKLINFLLWLIENRHLVKMNAKIRYCGRKRALLNNWIVLILFCALLIEILAVGMLYNAKLAYLQVGLVLVIFGSAIGLTALCRKLKTAGTINLILSLAVGFGLSVICMTVIVIVFIEAVIGNHTKIQYKVQKDNGVVVMTTLYQDQVPVTMEDLGIQGSGVKTSEREEKSTVFASDISYDESYVNIESGEEEYETGISYEIFTSPFEGIMKKYIEKELYHGYRDFPQAWEKTDADIWKADKVYSRYYDEDQSTEYLVFYQQAVLDFHSEGELTGEKIAVIRDKLNQETDVIPAADIK